MTEEYCQICGTELTRDAEALCKKILSFKEKYCLDCLAEELKVSRDCVDGMIRSYKYRGCPEFV